MRKTSANTALALLIGCSLWLSGCAARMAPSVPPQKSSAEQSQQLAAGYDLDRLWQRVVELTSPALQGRAAGSSGEDLAADYLVQELRALQLAPWPDASQADYRQSFRIPRRAQVAENLLAAIPGSSQQSWLVVCAHYDHLGMRKGTLYPGADDNAVGVAALLEIVSCLSQSGLQPARSVLVALLSGEETGLQGSVALARALQRAGLTSDTIVLNLDMLGGVGGDSLDVWLEPSRPSGQAIAEIALGEIRASGVTAELIRRRFAPVDSRSFARRGLPSLTLSWDLAKRHHPYRHTPEDTPDHLRLDLIEQASRAALRVAWALANYRR